MKKIEVKQIRLKLATKLIPTTLLIVLLGSAISPAYALTLYVDPTTNQVYTTPGENRVKLGTFKQVDQADTTQTPEEVKAVKTKLIKKCKNSK